MGFILMYDVTNEDSFKCVQDWVTQIKTYSWDNAQVVLVGERPPEAEPNLSASLLENQDAIFFRVFFQLSSPSISFVLCLF